MHELDRASLNIFMLEEYLKGTSNSKIRIFV